MTARRTSLVALTLLLVAACGDGASPAGGPDLPALEIRVARASGDLPDRDPFSEAWDEAPEVVVRLVVQDVAQPRLLDASAETLRLRALHDGERAAFRLTWEDEGVDDLVDVDRSSDAVAIQLPANGEGPLPDSMMGEEGSPVAITLWRASWQRRADGGTHGVEALYPNALIDHYPPEAAKGEADRAELTRLYEPPVAVGNPVAARTIAEPVEDLLAHGFGSLTHVDDRRSTGRGVHRDGHWSVVIARPLDLAPGSAGSLRPGRSTYLAVALWDGGRNQRGSLKMRSIWVPLEIPEVKR